MKMITDIDLILIYWYEKYLDFALVVLGVFASFQSWRADVCPGVKDTNPNSARLIILHFRKKYQHVFMIINLSYLLYIYKSKKKIKHKTTWSNAICLSLPTCKCKGIFCCCIQTIYWSQRTCNLGILSSGSS